VQKINDNNNLNLEGVVVINLILMNQSMYCACFFFGREEGGVRMLRNVQPGRATSEAPLNS
jgi:hypothetical protein